MVKNKENTFGSRRGANRRKLAPRSTNDFCTLFLAPLICFNKFVLSHRVSTAPDRISDYSTCLTLSHRLVRNFGRGSLIEILRPILFPKFCTPKVYVHV